MFTCPEKDIHSIYLDNELPDNFKADYEAHIENCPKCKAVLDQMRKTHEAFQYDAASITLDQEFLDKSFERLQTKMHYSKVVSESSDSNTIMFPIAKKYIPAAVAAAAIFALCLPISIRSKQNASGNESVAQIQTIKRTTVFSIDQNRLLTEASNAGYPLNLAADTSKSNYGETNFTLKSFTPSLNTTSTSVTQVNTQSVSNASNLMSDDFFSPSFIHNNDTSLQIYMPTYVDISSLNE